MLTLQSVSPVLSNRMPLRGQTLQLQKAIFFQGKSFILLKGEKLSQFSQKAHFSYIFIRFFIHF